MIAGRIAVMRLLLLNFAAWAEPIAPGEIEVIDGDTIRAYGVMVVRLVGFDTPETGLRAQCESERTRGAEAARRLRVLVAGGGLDFVEVPCSCPAGRQGTQACNYGRSCGMLTVRGKDVAEIMISEWLA